MTDTPTPMTLSHAWLYSLAEIFARGIPVSPRGKKTLEVLHRTTRVNMRYPVLTVPDRKLSYQFMAAEAYWILSGDNKVSGVAPWNKRIADFSDDGETFFGAYGPRIHEQLDFVVAKLLEDHDTRQATLTTWRPNPPKTKDTPCTVAFTFQLRQNPAQSSMRLHLHVYMRSNDVWLGLPYDAFNFSMLAHLVCCKLNKTWNGWTQNLNAMLSVKPGDLYLTAASSHLYEEHWEAAEAIRTRGLLDQGELITIQRRTPGFLFFVEVQLMTRLQALRDTTTGNDLRWWEP